MSSEILIRGIPKEVRDWNSQESHENRVSQNEFWSICSDARSAALHRNQDSSASLRQVPKGILTAALNTRQRFRSRSLTFSLELELRLALERVGGTCRFSVSGTGTVNAHKAGWRDASRRHPKD